MQRRTLLLLPLVAATAGCAQQMQIGQSVAAQPYTQAELDKNVDQFLRGDVLRARYAGFTQVLRTVEFDIQYLINVILISNVKLTLDSGAPAGGAGANVIQQAQAIREDKKFDLVFHIMSDDDKTEFAFASFYSVNLDRRSDVAGHRTYDLGQRKLALDLKFAPTREALVQQPSYFRIWTYVVAEGGGTGGAGNGPSLFNEYLRPL